jgi:hypothetical protein
MNEDGLDAYLRKQLQQNTQAVPELVSLRMSSTLLSLKKKRGWLRKVSYGAIAACFVFGCLTTAGFVFPGIAKALKNVPVFASVFEIMGDEGTRLSSEAGLSTKVNITAENQGITMTINEVLYDGVRISVGYVMETKGGEIRPNQMELYVNGKRLNASVGISGREVSNQLFAGIIDYDLKEQLPDQFNLKINYQSMNDYAPSFGNIPKEIKGAWKFDLPVTKLKQGIVTKTFAEAPQAKFQDHMISVKKVIFTPVVTAIQLDTIEPLEPKKNVTIEQGQKQFVEQGFQVFDDRGIIMENLSESASSSTKNGSLLRKTEHQILLAPLQRIPEYLVIRPYTITHSTDPAIKPIFVKARLNDASLPITLSQGTMGTITVTKVEYLEDKTLLYYQVKGEDPYRQADAVHLEGDTGQRYGKINRQAIRLDDLAHSFRMTFPPFAKNQELQVVTSEMERIETTKELELKIPLNQ